MYKILTTSKLNFDPIRPEGGYFMIANIERALFQMPICYFYKKDSANFQKNKDNYLI